MLNNCCIGDIVCLGTIAFCDSVGNAPSRYQSYCTLPRPEQIDFDQHSNYGNEISHMAKQINQLYGPYNAQIQPSISPNPISKQVYTIFSTQKCLFEV